jgi:23S rRNA (uracil1939-C5)-methyltransferase
MISANCTVELVVEKPAAGGRMVARADGQVILVAGAIPGERVVARIARVAKGVAFADTIAVVDASPDRREPFVDRQCGGSLYSYIAYPRQLAIKSAVIADAFRRIGRLELPGTVPVAASPEEGYRMRARLHARARRVGFFREGTHDICDARATRQLLPAACDVLDRLAAAIRSIGDDDIHEIELSENVDATERVVHLGAMRPIDPRLVDKLTSIDGLTPGPYVTDALRVAGSELTLRRHVLAFFQGNRYLLADLVAHVTERVPVGAPLLDLYAGVGLFAAAAVVLRRAPTVAIEGDRVAFDDLCANATAAGTQLTAIRAAVEGLGAGVLKAGQLFRGGHVEVVVVDPPRTGVSPEALAAVLGLKAACLIYVSCDVATLARDARRIVAAGHTIARVDAFDLFPNTPHVETVVVFQRR